LPWLRGVRGRWAASDLTGRWPCPQPPLRVATHPSVVVSWQGAEAETFRGILERLWERSHVDVTYQSANQNVPFYVNNKLALGTPRPDGPGLDPRECGRGGPHAVPHCVNPVFNGKGKGAMIMEGDFIQALAGP
jgi:hypothetical protein